MLWENVKSQQNNYETIPEPDRHQDQKPAPLGSVICIDK